MEEEKKLDLNSIIGFVLIGVILIWVLYNNRPTPEEIKQREVAQKEQQELQTQEPAKVILEEKKETLVNPSLLGAFMPPPNAESLADSLITIENDIAVYKVKLKGGGLEQIRLKEFQTYKGENLYIADEDNHSFNIFFTTTDNRFINTKDLIFEPSLRNLGDVQELSLKAFVSDNQYLEYIYSIRKGDYLIDFKVQSKGLQEVANQMTPAKMEWNLKAFRHAKSVEYENRYTMITYQYDKDKTSDLNIGGKDEEQEKNVNWISYRQHFFSSIFIADKGFDNVTLKSNNLVEEEDESIQYTKFFSSVMPLPLGQDNFSKSFHWYFGPTDYEVLKTYDRYNLQESMPLGWGIFGWLNRYVFIPSFSFLSSVFPHGIAIIILTIIVRLLMSPVTYKSYVSQARMKVLRPEITEINEKYPGKDNAMKRQQATMDIYKKAGVNPMSGCLPSLLQIPIFYALFTFFPTAFVLRQKKFLWADDLSSYDVIAHLPFNIPFYGDHISLFPLLASIAIFIYMLMTTGQTMQQTQQPGMPNMKFMIYLSPVMMLFFFNNYASGLSLYYFISNLITIFIMLVIKKYIIDEDKIHAKIQENKKKPKKVGRFQKRMQEMMEQAEQQKKSKRRK